LEVADALAPQMMEECGEHGEEGDEGDGGGFAADRDDGEDGGGGAPFPEGAGMEAALEEAPEGCEGGAAADEVLAFDDPGDGFDALGVDGPDEGGCEGGPAVGAEASAAGHEEERGGGVEEIVVEVVGDVGGGGGAEERAVEHQREHRAWRIEILIGRGEIEPDVREAEAEALVVDDEGAVVPVVQEWRGDVGEEEREYEDGEQRLQPVALQEASEIREPVRHVTTGSDGPVRA
jgi:hypothetical protein